MKWPNWLYKNSESQSNKAGSTMAGSFSIRHMLQGENPFAAQIPASVPSEPEKKRLIINDFSLRYELNEVLIAILTCVETLLQDGFEIYVVKRDAPRSLHRISSDIKECNLLRVFHYTFPIRNDQVHTIDPDYTADGTVLLNYRSIRRLIFEVTGHPFDFDIRQELTAKHTVDYLQLMVIPFYEETGYTLQGHALPDLLLDKHVFAYLEYKSRQLSTQSDVNEEILNCLNWGFRFIIKDMATLVRCLEDSNFPHEKIIGLHIQSEAELNQFIALNRPLMHIEKVWFFGTTARLKQEVNPWVPNMKSSHCTGDRLPPRISGQSPANQTQQTTVHETPVDLAQRLQNPNTEWMLSLRNLTPQSLTRGLIGMDEANTPEYYGKLARLRRHCHPVLVVADFCTLKKYLNLMQGGGVRTVLVTVSAETEFPDFMRHNNVRQLMLILRYVPSEEEVEKIIYYFTGTFHLKIHIDSDLILSDPDRYFRFLRAISKSCCESGETEFYEAHLPMMETVDRLMNDFYHLLDPVTHATLRRKIEKFLAEGIDYLSYRYQPAQVQAEPVIYDGDRSSGPGLPMGQSAQTTTFNMVKACEILEGGTHYPVIRRRKFYYDFSNASGMNLVKQYLQPEFAPSLPETHGLRPTHKMFSTGSFEWNATYQVYVHQLPGLTRYDKLCDWSVIRGAGNFELRYSISDQFYYMVSNALPNHEVEFSYRLHAPSSVNTQAYPDEVSIYRKEFKCEDRANPVYSLEDAREHAEYYTCAQRTAAFLYEHRDHPARFLGVESRTHEWIEHESGTLDLGGRPSHLVHPSQPRPLIIPPEDYIPFHEPETLYTVSQLQEILERQSTNTLLLFDDPNALESVRLQMIQVLRDTVIVIDKPSDLKTSVPYLSVAGHVPEMGALPGGWIANHLRSSQYDVLLIDWSSFNGRELAQNNTCIGKVDQRKIENFPLHEKFHVLGLAMRNSPAAQDRSHVSRHKGNVYYVSSTAIPRWTPQFNQGKISLTIDLYGSPRWFDILLGRIELEDGVLNGYLGALFPSRYSKLIIKNPPAHCKEFYRFITHLRSGTYYQYFDKSFRFHSPIEVKLVGGYDFQVYAGLIEQVFQKVEDKALHHYPIDQLVNPSTFERLFHDTFIDENKILRKSPGWLQRGYRHFYITRTLPYFQLCAWLDYFMKLPGPVSKLHLYCAPGVELPVKLTQQASLISRLPPVSSDQEDAISADIQPDFFVNVTGRSIDDLLYGNQVTQHNGLFTFKEEQSDLWLALKRGQHLSLTGQFSDEMIDHLATLLLPRPYLWHQHDKVFVKGVVTLSPSVKIPHLSWITSYGRIVNFSQPPLNLVSFELSQQDNRKLALDHMFSLDPAQPAVLIQGAPGIGKSSFIRELINDYSHEYRIFSENQCVDWASDTTNHGKYSVLVIDESTIRETDWSVFEGLYLNPPHVLIKNKMYFLKPHQRVIFLGNVTPHMPSLFKRVAKITFQSMTREAIIHNILRPILNNEAEAFYAARPKHSVRELHAEAIAYRARQNPRHSRFSDNFGHFDLTPSRLPIVQSLIHCLNARHFRKMAVQDQAKYGGQSGLWIEGPPGIGKTELIRATLRALGYCEGSDYWVFPASMDPKAMMQKLVEAFHAGMIVVIDELDTALSPELIAQINSYLMGENLNYERPQTPGFTLLATGNGPGYAGRIPLPESLKSRLHCLPLGEYSESEARQILHKRFQSILAVKPDFAWVIEGHVLYYKAYSNRFTFREACDWLMEGGNPVIPRRAPKSYAAPSQTTAGLQTSAYQRPPANVESHRDASLSTSNLVI